MNMKELQRKGHIYLVWFPCSSCPCGSAPVPTSHKSTLTSTPTSSCTSDVLILSTFFSKSGSTINDTLRGCLAFYFIFLFRCFSPETCWCVTNKSLLFFGDFVFGGEGCPLPAVCYFQRRQSEHKHNRKSGFLRFGGGQSARL